ncbi:ATP-binding protein [Candidatus Methylobacter oryzae]|nr:ATP-binding protein [Candidatus Methylobacter oryzae]
MILGKIISRLMLGFLLLSPLPLAGLAYLYVQAFRDTLQHSELENLSSLADKKADQINAYINERMADARLLAQLFVVFDSRQPQSILQSGEQNLSPLSYQAEEVYHDFFHTLFENRHYYDLLLTDTAGNVVFSILHESDFGSNLNTGPYRDSTLAKAHREAIALLDIQITQAGSYAPSAGKTAIFIVAPLFKAGKVIGTLALQMDLDNLTGVSSDTTGLGKTGETVLAQLGGDEVLYVGGLQHIPDAAFHYRVPLDKLSLPMQLALSGSHDKGIIHDYAGVEVIGAWRYLPALRWGMVVKMDASEAFAPLYHLQKISLVVLIFMSLIAGIVALLLSRALVAPIRQLIMATERIIGGDLNRRAPLDGCDEFRQLATSFNTMTEHLQFHYEDLERQVEQRTAEIRSVMDQLNNAQHIAQLGSWELNLTDNTLIWSDEIFHLFEIDKDKFGATYEAFLHAIHPEDLDAVDAAYTRSLQTQRPYEITHRLLMPDGRVKFVTERCASYFDSDGKPVRSVGTVQDVTELKQVEQALKQLNEELEQRVQQRTDLLLHAKEEADRANNAKSEFLSRMSHELRTPMNAIIGFAQLLETDRETPLTPDQADNVREIRHAGKHLLELINEVLDLARIETGRIELSLEPVELRLLIGECMALLQPLASERRIELTADMDRAVTVQADRLRLRQILLNLLSNAVKYNRDQGRVHIFCESVAEDKAELSSLPAQTKLMPSGYKAELSGLPAQTKLMPSGYKAELSSLPAQTLLMPEGHKVRIAVQDSGRGITVEALPRLFKPFERIESAYDGIEGTGIGLALCKRLVEAMSGSIGVESIVDQGSTFWIELPAAQAEEYIPEDSGSTATQNTYAAKRTVLYIEDNPANLRLLRKVISTHTSLSLLESHSAEKGLDIAAAHSPDLILLDINLPGMNGFDALRRLKDNPDTRDIPVVAISANAMERDIKKGAAAGFSDYLTKPLDIPKLLALLASIQESETTQTIP